MTTPDTSIVRPGTAVRDRAPARVAERRGPNLARIGLVIAVLLVMLFCLFPFYWMVNVSLKAGADLNSAALVPPSPTLRNYDTVLSDGDFVKAIRNSAIVSISVTVISLIVGSFAGYALARLYFPKKFLLLAVILSISTFPPIAIAAPVFDLWTDLGLYNTYPGLILPTLTFALPLTIYTLASFFREIPKDLSEAALVDGATPFQAFRQVIVPLAAPGVVTAGLLTFIFAWNEFLFAVTLSSNPNVQTAPVAISSFSGVVQFQQPLGAITAASVIITVPLVILVLIFQRRIVAGLTAGAVKG
jgi:multiple sugar transport system permease protein